MSEHENRLNVGQVLGGRYRMVSDGDALDVGVEYKTYDMQLDRLAVITILDRRFGGDAEVVDRLAEVQQAVADLNEPALPPIEEMGIVDGQLYLVRRPQEGRVLASLLARSGLLNVSEVLKIVIAMCQALIPLHQVHLVHGGLSPNSVLVGDDGNVTLIDTAVFPALQQRAKEPDQPWGRLPYISPEQAAGLDVRATSDVYVIGLLMYEMLAGRPPFRRGDEAMTVLQHMRYEPPSLRILVPDVPQSLAQIVHTALAKEPAARYRNASQLAHILSTQLGMLATPLPPPAEVPLYTSPARSMVVPPPPPVERRLADQDNWSEEGTGIDWIMIALLAAALIMILGLIPLWRTVYQRYAIPSPPSTVRSYQPAQPTLSWLLLDDADQGGRVSKLVAVEPGRHERYDPTMSGASLAPVVRRNLRWSGATAFGGGFPGLGVQITVLGAT